MSTMLLTPVLTPTTLEAHHMTKHIKTTALDKPPKPYPDFPLFAHATNRWAKKIRGRLHYFGPWDDSDGALQKYREQSDDLHAGRVPKPKADVLQLRDLLNHFLTAKQRKLDAGELKQKTFGDYHRCGTKFVDAFSPRHLVNDLRPEDFARFRSQLEKVRGPIALGNEVQRIRSIFRYGYEAGLMDKPMRFGPEFNKPSQKMLRDDRAAAGQRMLKPRQIIALLEEASIQMRAMILLGINCGFGNTDCADLPRSAIDFDIRVVDFRRPKTAIPRRATLWPETVRELRNAITVRPKPKSKAHNSLVFITRFGHPWVQGKTDSVGWEFDKLMRKLKFTCPGRFYTLRHVFRTIADQTRDFPSIDRILGHEDASAMASRYRERISDQRLKAVGDHVRAWLFQK